MKKTRSSLVTKDLKLGRYYWCIPMNDHVRLVTIDKSGFKRHSTVRFVVESCTNGLRRILRTASALIESDKAGRVKVKP